MIFRWMRDRDDDWDDDDPPFRRFDRADPWAAGRARDRYLDPEPTERPEGQIRFREFDRSDPFASKDYPKVPAPPPTTEREGGALDWDEYHPDAWWRERSLRFVEPDRAELADQLKPVPPPSPGPLPTALELLPIPERPAWSYLYEAHHWPADGEDQSRLSFSTPPPQPHTTDEQGPTFVPPRVSDEDLRYQELANRVYGRWPEVEARLIDVAVTEHEDRDGNVSGQIDIQYYGNTPAQYGTTETWMPLPGLRDWAVEERPEKDDTEAAERAERDDWAGLWFPYVAPGAATGDEKREAEGEDDEGDNERAGLGGLLWG